MRQQTAHTRAGRSHKACELKQFQEGLHQVIAMNRIDARESNEVTQFVSAISCFRRHTSLINDLSGVGVECKRG